MNNDLLFFLAIAVNFSMVLVFFRFFREKGIYAWVAMATILANMEVIKCCDIFGWAVTLGNVTYGSLFLCTDILAEMYGKAAARRAVMIGFFALTASTVMMQVSLAFDPNEADFAGSAFETIFSLAPRICVTSIVCFLLSNSLDVQLYSWMSHLGLPIWLKNNGATLTAQAFDTIAFTLCAFWGVFPWHTLWELVLTSYILKAVIAAADTPFLYAARAIARRYHTVPQ